MKEAYAAWGQDYKKSLGLFENASDLFGNAKDYPEALVAEYWMSFSHHQDKHQQESRQILDPLLSAFENRHYLWLQVRAHYLLSSIDYGENKHSDAVNSALRAAQLASSINDSVGLLSATGALIEYYRYLGSYANALIWIQRGLPLLSSSRDSFQVIRYYTFAGNAFTTFGLHDAAVGYQQEAFRFAFNTSSDKAKSQNYADIGAKQGKLKNFDEALKNVQLAFDLAQAQSDHNLMAYAALQMGDIYRDEDEFDQAVARYTESINLYQTLKFETHLYHAHKGRFLCYLRQQNDQLAQAEISVLFKLIDKYRRQISYEDSRNVFFDREQTVVDAAIDFEYSRMNNPELAFNYANSARARSLLDRLNTDAGGVQDADTKFQAVSEPRSLEMIQQQLPQQTQVVQYVVLENKLLIFVISPRSNLQHTMYPISKGELNEKLAEYLNIISRPPKDDTSQELRLAKDLYSILIKPVEKLFGKQKLLCIIPDGTLSYLPFTALVSPESGRYLVEDFLLMTSPSASVFLSCSEKALQKIGQRDESVLSVGNPTFDRAAFPDFENLPDAEREAVKVGRYYKSRVVLPENLATKAAVKSYIERSDVIHLALHSKVDDEVPLRSQLLLAKTGEVSDSVFYAYEIYNLKLSPTRLVVLSSCQSGAGRYYGGEGVSSLARAFISAGAPLVVASLWPVESSATDMLMVSFHRYRTQQERTSTVEALRKAQQEMVHGSAENLRRPYYWAAFTVTGGYAEF
jgi:CHAT domain-containing protein